MLAIQLNELATRVSELRSCKSESNGARHSRHSAQGFTGVIVQLEAAEDAISCGCRNEADDHFASRR